MFLAGGGLGAHQCQFQCHRSVTVKSLESAPNFLEAIEDQVEPEGEIL
ncbi:MAG: hypothetical protein ACI8XO_002809 [Verrucomicrobiales bacterium]|jgi:hypothetical protein